MAENEETATARYIASNASTKLMLKTMFEIIATMADDPEKYQSALRKKLLELTDSIAPMSCSMAVRILSPLACCPSACQPVRREAGIACGRLV
jgi:hypothetical protein